MASIDNTLAALRDLSTYPEWNEIVKAVEPDPSGGAWYATLEARIGPLARSKRLRLIRDTSYPPNVVTFLRSEPERTHYAKWKMQATVTTLPSSDTLPSSAPTDQCAVQLDLSYDGSLWTAPLGPILASAIDEAVQQLPSYVRQNSR